MGLRLLGLLGDIHAEDARLERALAHMKQAGVDAILSVGDIVDGPGDVERCVRLLAQHDVIAVKGNHDRWYVRGNFMNDDDRRRMGWTVSGTLSTASLAWLTFLPATRAIDTEAGRLLLCHGVGDDDMKRFEPTTTLEHADEMRDLLATQAHAFIVGGHTHIRMARVLEGVLVINAGTLTDRGDDKPCFAILDVVTRDVRFVDL